MGYLQAPRVTQGDQGWPRILWAHGGWFAGLGAGIPCWTIPKITGMCVCWYATKSAHRIANNFHWDSLGIFANT